MGARLRYLAIILIVAIILAVAIILINAEIRVYGTGFTGKTLWEWLQLLIVPLVLAVIALVFQLANSRTERQIAKQRYEQDQQIAKQRYEQDQQIALDKQREDLLQAYLDRMTQLLLEKQLRTSEPDSEVRNVARARTLTVLPQLDAQRKGNLIQFLSESKLLEIINLSGAHLSGAHLSGAHLSNADLSGAHLTSADLSNANLSKANLYSADLSNADLSKANLIRAGLSKANLSFANLDDADLTLARLSAATLSFANLYGADLSHADLKDAIGISTYGPEKQAISLKGATLPDGSIHP